MLVLLYESVLAYNHITIWTPGFNAIYSKYFFPEGKNPTTRTHVQFNSEEKSVAIQVALSTKKRKKKEKMSEVPQISSYRQQNP